MHTFICIYKNTYMYDTYNTAHRCQWALKDFLFSLRDLREYDAGAVP